MTLTPAQSLLMESIHRGNLPAPEVASDLRVSPKTINTQVQRINQKYHSRHWLESYHKWLKGRASDSPLPVALAMSARAVPGVDKLTEAEYLMRDVLLLPLVAKFWPDAQPELLIALEALAKARKYLQESPKILKSSPW